MAIPRQRETGKVRQAAAGNGMEDQRVDRESLHRASGRSLRPGTRSEVHLDKTAGRGWTNTGVGRESGRFGPLDFKPKSLQDGFGEDWPISYEDLAPYYDKVETLIGVAGGGEDVYNSPANKNILPAFRPRCGEWLIKKGAAKLGIKTVAFPLAVLSKPYDNRLACHYCGACNFGCDTASRFSTLEVLFPKLQKMKNFTLRTNAAVHRVLLDPSTGKARGVSYIDT